MNSSSSESVESNLLSIIGAILLLLVRGVLLWVVVPVASGWWLIAIPFDAMRRRSRVGFSQAIGWADLNLIATLTLGRMTPFVRWSEASKVEHRISLIDPA